MTFHADSVLYGVGEWHLRPRETYRPDADRPDMNLAMLVARSACDRLALDLRHAGGRNPEEVAHVPRREPRIAELPGGG